VEWPPTKEKSMAIIGKVESLWRYPVKSMRGEELSEAFVGFAGVYGDRLFAFRSAERPTGFPYLTGREQMKMVLYRPRFRHPDKAAKPPNLAEAESIEPGLSPIFADPADLALDVETVDLDKRRFRANVFMDLASTDGFAEDGFVGRMLRIGSKTVVSILERDPRCAMISLDPDTAERNPAILGKVTKAHDGKAGVYGAVLIEGLVRIGDDIEVLD
jgi:uncharacterized protein YcbX